MFLFSVEMNGRALHSVDSDHDENDTGAFTAAIMRNKGDFFVEMNGRALHSGDSDDDENDTGSCNYSNNYARQMTFYRRNEWKRPAFCRFRR